MSLHFMMQVVAIEGIPWKRPWVTSDTLQDSPKNFFPFPFTYKGEFDMRSRVTLTVGFEHCYMYFEYVLWLECSIRMFCFITCWEFLQNPFQLNYNSMFSLTCSHNSPPLLKNKRNSSENNILNKTWIHCTLSGDKSKERPPISRKWLLYLLNIMIKHNNNS